MWRDTLDSLVRSGRFSTQGDLVAALREAGHDVTQGTVSRELRARGIRKVGGRYVPPSVAGLPDGIEVVAADRCAGPLVVLRTGPAMAPLLGQAIDDASITGVVGTIAGDDTVFVACAPGADLSALSRLVALPLR